MSRLDGTLLREQQAWKTLLAQFGEQPFDEGMKKPRGTFAVAGAACAPGGRSVQAITVSVELAGLRKSLNVFGERYWRRGGLGWEPGDPEPFMHMPLTLAQAYGGPGCVANPGGRGFAPSAPDPSAVAMPNVEDPDALCVALSDQPNPATYLPLPPGSPARARWLGTFDVQRRPAEKRQYPDDTDPRFFDAVSQDQCFAGYLMGDESFRIAGMSERVDVLEGPLPGVRPRLLWRAAPVNQVGCEPEASTAATGQVFESRLDLDTVWLFPNEELVLSLYRACWCVTDADADDVAALYVVTERLGDAPTATTELANRWREQQAVPNPATSLAIPPPAQLTQPAEYLHSVAKQARLDAVWASIVEKRQGIVDHIATRPDAQRLLEYVPSLNREAFDAANASTTPRAPRGSAREVVEAARNRMRMELERARLSTQEVNGLLTLSPPTEKRDAFAFLAELRGARAMQHEVMQAHWQSFEDLLAAAQRVSTAPPTSKLPPVELPSTQQTIDVPSLLVRLAARESVKGIRMSGQILAGLDLSGLNFTDSVFEQCDFTGAHLMDCKLTEVRLNACDLSGAVLTGAHAELSRLSDCRLDHAEMSASNWQSTRWERCTADGANLSKAVFGQATLRDCRFSHAQATGLYAELATFTACVMDDADLSGADLRRSTFSRCQVHRLALGRAQLTAAQWRGVSGAGAKFGGAQLINWRVWGTTQLSSSDFTAADLRRASLRDSSFVNSCLRDAVMDRAVALRCDLSGTDGYHLCARDVQFTGSRIANARWRGANLMGASLRKTQLVDWDLGGSNLYGVQATGANIAGVQVEGALLTRCELMEL
ncbi:DUF2169 domain-containing protein [Paraburkholderia sediminicola]|uniref:DUF2169 family type VI secretion system accessory protein n=1 Tax=Paraburkholderia sediminicola TaxID=458836 RepID=UPI0038B6C76A